MISRVFSPGSKLRTVDYLLRYQSHLYEISSVYRFLDRLCDRRGGEGIKSQVEQIAYAHTQKVVGDYTAREGMVYVRDDDTKRSPFGQPPVVANYFYHEQVKKSAKVKAR